jgi:allantoinase
MKAPLGPDHAWFRYRTIKDDSGLVLPPGKRIALFASVPLEFFPLDAPAQPFRPSGSLDRPYPDTWDYANRDYGNRLGIYRLLSIFERLGIHATAFVDSATALRYPHVIAAIAEASWEIAASGIDRGHLHYGGLDRNEERALIVDSLRTIRAVSAAPVIGWQSPGLSESDATLELLASEGVSYVADWVNDDLPYTVTTPQGVLTALPMSYELSDRNILVHHDFTVDEYVAQCLAAWQRLLVESERAPRVLSLTITPWVLGYPHRVRALATLLETLTASPFTWTVTGSELAGAYGSDDSVSKSK